MIGFYLMARDGVISKLDGAILVATLTAFLVFLVVDARRTGRRQDTDEEAAVTDALLPTRKKLMFLLGGVIMLSAGAQLMVGGAVRIADALGVPSVVVGLTVVAIGTSLPELAASVMCAIRQEADLSVGNVIGSNLLNVLFVVGLVSLIRPLAVDAESISTHFPVMILFTLVLLPIARTQYQIGRLEGAMLVAGFLGYMIFLVVPYI
jgi:cation:H+ antiporter